MDKRVKIFDTTLRDGEQSPGCSMNLKEKLEVARQLDKLKVDVIEAGFAISSPGDFESVKAIAETIKNCSVASLCRSLPKDIDASYEAIKNAVSPRIHVFISTSPLHMEYKLKMKPEAVFEQAVQMIKYAKKYCHDIEFSAEDATRTDRAFLARIVEATIAAGATVVNIPDTVGYNTPTEMYDLISYIRNTVPNIDKAEISVHCHNDLGLAVANSLEAVRAGATQIECTINGLGERAGNAALEEIVMALNTRKHLYEVGCGIDTTRIAKASRAVYKIIGMAAPLNKPIVGVNAFAHESGIHQHGVLANRETYEIMTPQSIGLSTNKLVLGKHSGRHAFEVALSELGHSFEAAELNELFDKFKILCDKKKDISDEDLEALVSHIDENNGIYKLNKFIVNSGTAITSSCTISLTKGEEEVIEEVSLGDGPVDAAYKAIDKIVNVDGYLLDDYIIHSVTEGQDALGEVVAKIKYNGKIITGRGISTDIVESSILAYINGINKILA